ncbi:MAG: tetratricopeptide repeat protein [Saprospirales bacterium]|nr:tetratricopeptide repeat protein [Saprospirales bacterium]
MKKQKKSPEKLGGSLQPMAVVVLTMEEFCILKEIIRKQKMVPRSHSHSGKSLGKDHPDYATSLNNWQCCTIVWGQNEKAEPLFLEAKAIREKALGKDHP